tara:strand:- start:3623 stop:5416 length:1794 start_codon:yes stop_codon:yes gene_type:complete
MKFSCTNNSTLITNLEGALFHPIPYENELWLPNKIHCLPMDFFQKIDTMSFNEIAYTVAKELIGSEIPENKLREIIDSSFNFDIPLHTLSENLHILELFHGPTFTFKDFGARFMSKIIKYFIGDKDIDILVSTSGDTGSAVADAFYEIPNVKVHILYPKNRISSVQELQITNYGKNIIAYEVDGNFDDCQKMVKDTLADTTLKKLMTFFPANSISIARLIPQSFYYFWIYAQLKKQKCKINPIYISVPSGNLGNITGGIIAFKMGLPVKLFIAATNDNKAFGEYLYSNHISQKKAKHTISNAMDIGIPNNLIRLKSIFNDNKDMQTKIASFSISDIETKKTINNVYKKYKYTLDPHTAVGYSALERYISENSIENFTGIILATAHPAKFPEVMTRLNAPYIIPKKIYKMKDSGIKYCIKKDYKTWKNILIKSKNFKNVTLIGMPASGKSYIASVLSKKNRWNVLDIDRLIEDRYGKRLHKIIEEQGIEEFSKIEEYTAMSMTGINTIFSPGGSIINSKNAIEYLKSISLVIYLYTPFETINQRIKNPKKRGILIKDGETMRDLYNERVPLYEKYAHIIIDCSVNNESDICDIIMKYI